MTELLAFFDQHAIGLWFLLWWFGLCYVIRGIGWPRES